MKESSRIEFKAYPKECFKFTENFIRMSFPRFGGISDDDGDKIGGSIGGSIEITDRQNEVLSLMIQNNKVSKKQLAETLRINSSAIDKHIENLKSKGLIRRIGGTRGYWKVNT